MTWISECKAPDLTGLRIPVIVNYMLNVAFTDRGGHNDPIVRTWVHNFIVTTDKAIRSYNRGRELLVQYAQSANRTTLLIEGVGEFETCIGSCRRAFRFAQRMATHPENPEIERTVRRLMDVYERQIRPIRDAIEHIDQDIANGDVVQGEPNMLCPTKDGGGLQIAKHGISFDQLASALQTIHALALALAHRDRGA